MLFINAAEVRQALPMSVAIGAMREAFATFSSGQAEMPLRTHLPVSSEDASVLVMPVFARGRERNFLAVKAASVFPGNSQRGLPTIVGAVLVFNPETGEPLALLEGGTLTAIRTGAASGLATDLLAREDSQVVGLLGAGAQARTQLEAVCTVRSISTVWVYAPHRESVEMLIDDLAGKGPIPLEVRWADTSRKAVADADIICTATSSAQPVFQDADLKPGVHINAVGSHLPAMQEVPASTVARALVIVDSRVAAFAEAGDLIQPVRSGTISRDHIHAELGELVLERKTGRHSPDQLTLFKSVGVAVQDAVAARVVVDNAQRWSLGREVEW